MRTIQKAIMAGVAIGIGGAVNLAAGRGIPGAVLFSVGLLAVLMFDYSLYTGKVCYLADGLPVILIGNLIGAVGVGLLLRLTNVQVGEAARMISLAKLEEPWKAVPNGVLCNVLIYWGVEAYRKSASPIPTMLCVAVFVAAGFDHCVANAFYFAAGGVVSIRMIGFMALNVAGNTIGGIAARLMTEEVTR